MTVLGLGEAAVAPLAGSPYSRHLGASERSLSVLSGNACVHRDWPHPRQCAADRHRFQGCCPFRVRTLPGCAEAIHGALDPNAVRNEKRRDAVSFFATGYIKSPQRAAPTQAAHTPRQNVPEPPDLPRLPADNSSSSWFTTAEISPPPARPPPIRGSP